MKKFKRNLLSSCALLFFLFAQKGYAQENAINIGDMYISNGTIVSDESSFTTSATGTTENNGDFYLKGDWVNDGVYITGIGKVTFWGTAAQGISGTSGTVFYDAIVNKPSNSVTVYTDAEVNDVLTLTSGPVILNSHKITINNSATSAIGYTNGYLRSEQADNSGILKWNLATTTGAHVIPFGTAGGTIIPLTLDPTAGTLGYISTATYPTIPNNTPYPVTPTPVANMNNPSGVDNSANVVDRFWQIDIEDGYSGTETITFTYANGEEPANGETGLVSQRYFGGWEPPAPSQSANAVTNIVTTPGSTVFGPFTLSISTNPLPVEILYARAICQKNKILLSWATASETNTSHFIIQKSYDQINFVEIGKMKAKGSSTSENKYEFSEYSLSDQSGYYRIFEIDNNGRSYLLKQFSGTCSQSDNFNVSVYPNPVVGNYANAEISGLLDNENFQMSLSEANGKLIWQSNKMNADEKKEKNGTIKVRVAPEITLSPGIYFLHTETERTSSNLKMIVR
jgi:hypothetical protein